MITTASMALIHQVARYQFDVAFEAGGVLVGDPGDAGRELAGQSGAEPARRPAGATLTVCPLAIPRRRASSRES